MSSFSTKHKDFNSSGTLPSHSPFANARQGTFFPFLTDIQHSLHILQKKGVTRVEWKTEDQIVHE